MKIKTYIFKIRLPRLLATKVLLLVVYLIVLGIPTLLFAHKTTNGWVTTDGTKLKMGGKDFHYVGTNNYYLGIDSNRTQAEKTGQVCS